VDGYAEGRISTMAQIFDPPVEASTRRTGSLIVITGSMFSGKTEELIRRIRRALYAHRSAQVFKHTIDTRSENTEIRSHNGVLHEALAVSTSEEPAAATATRCPRAFSSMDSLAYSEPW
jgi:thymidine kinase